MPTQLHKVQAAKHAVLCLLVCHFLEVWTVRGALQVLHINILCDVSRHK